MTISTTTRRATTLVGLTCAAIWVAFLPPEPNTRGDAPSMLRSGVAHAEAWNARRMSRLNHARALWTQYRAASDVELAGRVFGPRAATPGAPNIWYGADVPAGARARVGAILAKEAAERGEWHGRGTVGVLVISDTEKTLDGVSVQRPRAQNVSLRTLAPRAAWGNRCVAVVRLGEPALHAPDSIRSPRPLLDACAFTDAFGPPGGAMREWLVASAFSMARVYEPALADSMRPVASAYWMSNVGSGIDYAASRHCRAGDDGACLKLIASYDATTAWDWRERDRALLPPDVSIEMWWRVNEQDRKLADLARDLGPDRFERVWRSDKPLAAAWQAETGEPLAGWIRRQELARYGALRVGPATSAWSLAITLLAVAGLFWMAVRYTPRPRVA